MNIPSKILLTNRVTKPICQGMSLLPNTYFVLKYWVWQLICSQCLAGYPSKQLIKAYEKCMHFLK